MIWKGAEDLMVESTYLRKLKVVSGWPLFVAQPMHDAGILSV